MGTRTLSWRDQCRRADPDFDEESRRPVVYRFPKSKEKREDTANSGAYRQED